MSDLRYLSQDHPPLTTECSGPEAIGQRILTLLFAPNDNTRSVGGDCFSLLQGRVVQGVHSTTAAGCPTSCPPSTRR